MIVNFQLRSCILSKRSETRFKNREFPATIIYLTINYRILPTTFHNENKAFINDKQSTRGYTFWSRKVFEGVHCHLKSQIQIIEKWTKIAFWHVIWTKSAISESIKLFFYSKLMITIIVRNKNLDQDRIFEASSSRESELLQTLFWAKKYTPA